MRSNYLCAQSFPVAFHFTRIKSWNLHNALKSPSVLSLCCFFHHLSSYAGHSGLGVLKELSTSRFAEPCACTYCLHLSTPEIQNGFHQRLTEVTCSISLKCYWAPLQNHYTLTWVPSSCPVFELSSLWDFSQDYILKRQTFAWNFTGIKQMKVEGIMVSYS